MAQIKTIVAIAKCLVEFVSKETRQVILATTKNKLHIESTRFTFLVNRLITHPKKAKANKLQVIKI
jgi:hypothetical protein